MRKFQELIKKAHVQDHPMFKGRAAQLRSMRANMSRKSQDLNLSDIFSERRQVGLSGDNKTLNAYVQEAFLSARQALNVLSFPIQPQLNFNNSKYVKYSSNDPTTVVAAEILFNIRMATVTGSIRQAVIPVTVSAGMVVPPSLMIYDGRPLLLGQSTVDTIVQRNSSYAMEPMRGMFSPILDPMELDQRVLERYEMGYQPREIDMDADGIRRTYKRHAEVPIDPEVLDSKNDPEANNLWELAQSGNDKGYTLGGSSNKGHGKDGSTAISLHPAVHKLMVAARSRMAQALGDSIWAPFTEDNLQKQVDGQVPITVGPEARDFIISPAGAMGEGFLVSIGDSEVIGEASSIEEAQEVINSYATTNEHFSDVWSVTEDGQVDFVMSDTDVGHKDADNMPNMDPTVEYYYKLYKDLDKAVEMAEAVKSHQVEAQVADDSGFDFGFEGAGMFGEGDVDAETEMYEYVKNDPAIMAEVQRSYDESSTNFPGTPTVIGQAVQSAVGNIGDPNINWENVGTMLREDGSLVESQGVAASRWDSLQARIVARCCK